MPKVLNDVILTDKILAFIGPSFCKLRFNGDAYAENLVTN